MSTSPEELPETPDTYEGAAEVDPDHWRDDPLIEGAEADVPEDEYADPARPVVPSEQQLRDETAEARFRAGDEQVPPEEPGMGEALADLDVPGNSEFEDEVDSSNDSFHGGGDPLS
ncbi:hypothetical protein [Kocuria aegyptia]|uniref:DUF5709 domain-containing protein n=1 Tax=Kocuria aegyptia TaxID=330943 RepID=A0ABP4WY98_9MICC